MITFKRTDEKKFKIHGYLYIKDGYHEEFAERLNDIFMEMTREGKTHNCISRTTEVHPDTQDVPIFRDEATNSKSRTFEEMRIRLQELEIQDFWALCIRLRKLEEYTKWVETA